MRIMDAAIRWNPLNYCSQSVYSETLTLSFIPITSTVYIQVYTANIDHVWGQQFFVVK